MNSYIVIIKGGFRNSPLLFSKKFSINANDNREAEVIAVSEFYSWSKSNPLWDLLFQKAKVHQVITR
jgi:hypothetical protein